MHPAEFEPTIPNKRAAADQRTARLMGLTKEAISHRKSIRQNMRLLPSLRATISLPYLYMVLILSNEMSFPIGSLIIHVFTSPLIHTPKREAQKRQEETMFAIQNMGYTRNSIRVVCSAVCNHRENSSIVSHS
jgi:hypothetical protein